MFSDPEQDDSASEKEEKDDYFVSITLILHSYTQGNSIPMLKSHIVLRSPFFASAVAVVL